MPLGYAKFNVGGVTYRVPIKEHYSGNPPTEKAHDSVWETCTRKDTNGGFLCFANGATLHCPYGPAKFLLGNYSYYLIGKKLNQDLSLKMEAILKNIELAPLYLNHKLLKYPARWVLKNYKKEL